VPFCGSRLQRLQLPLRQPIASRQVGENLLRSIAVAVIMAAARTGDAIAVGVAMPTAAIRVRHKLMAAATVNTADPRCSVGRRLLLLLLLHRCISLL